MKMCLKRNIRIGEIPSSLILFVVGCGLFLYYSALFNESLFGDDILNSCVKGDVIESGKDLFVFSLDIVKFWAHNGRLFPIPFFQTYYFWYFFGENILVYKLFSVLYNIICILLFSCVVSKMLNRPRTAILNAVILGISMPVFTFANDNPFYAYMFMVPNVMLLLSLSLLMALRFFETTKRKYLYISGLFATLSLYCYEIAYVILILLIILIVFRAKNKQEIIKNSIPIFIIVGIPALLNCLWAFSHNSVNYEGTKITFSKDIIKAFFYNAVAVFPFSSWVVQKSPSYLFSNPIDCYKNIDSVTIIAMSILVFVSYLSLRNEKEEKTDIKSFIVLMVIGILIWFFPCFLLSLSSRWRDYTVETHRPWIPQMMCYYGFAVFLTIAGVVINKIALLKKVFLFVLFFAICTICPIYSYSLRLQYKATKLYHEVPRKSIVQAVKSGIITIQPDSLILLDNKETPAVSPKVFSMLLKKVKTDYFWLSPEETYFEKNKNISASAIYVAYVTKSYPQRLILEKRDMVNTDLVTTVISYPPMTNSIKTGEEISFKGKIPNFFIYKGINIELGSDCSWTESRFPTLSFQFEDVSNAKPYNCKIAVHSVWNKKQDVKIFVNGENVKNLTLYPESKEINFSFSRSFDNNYTINFILPDSISPKELGINEDVRPFSFSFQEIVFSTSLLNETNQEM